MRENKPNEEEFGNTEAHEGFVRFFMSLGRKQGITISVILNSIYEKTGLSGRQVGNIDIFDNFSFVEIANEHASDFYRFMADTYIENKRVHLEPARPRDKEAEKSKNKRPKNKKRFKRNNHASKNFNPHKKDYRK